MVLTLTLTRPPATDLGYLLHKHPDRCQTFELPFGSAHVLYPEASEDRCTAALLLDVDPIDLVRGKGSTLRDYVNDRPYVASSFLSVAIARVYGTALSGRSKERPRLVETDLPLEAGLPVAPCAGDEDLVRRLFEPLGYETDIERHPVDPRVPEWDGGPYVTLRLNARIRLAQLLAHLYVLVPVLDDEKHYWITSDEVDKLLERGTGWLEGHPERELITRRYLKHQRSLTRTALDRLVDDGLEPGRPEHRVDGETLVEAPLRLAEQRIGVVVATLASVGARHVVDVGCGEGRLLEALMRDSRFEEIAGLDVSVRALERARNRLALERLPPEHRERIRLLHGSLVYRDRRLAGFDAAAVVEVIEHLDPSRLDAFERVLLGDARPHAIVLTTPNREYNVRFDDLPAGTLRHPDHRFEWTRKELRDWAHAAGDRFGYRCRFLPVGPEDPEVGPPTQMAVFER